MHRDAVHIIVGHLHLTGMQSGANRQAEILHRVADRTRAVDRPRRAVECRQNAVTRRLHDNSARGGDMPLDHAVVGGEGCRPRLVAELRCALGGSDDVGEQHGRQDPV